MNSGPVQESTTRFTLPEAALRLEVEEATIREWLSTVNWRPSLLFCNNSPAQLPSRSSACFTASNEEPGTAVAKSSWPRRPSASARL